MDPLSQGLVGGVLAQRVAGKKDFRPAFVIGFFSALLADLDVLIRSDYDPLLQLEYHRHFTHSLIFVPIGAFVGAVLLWLFVRKYYDFKRIFLFAFLGYLTAAPLDACTSFGTHLYWPFSNERTAWNIISIVDPIFTGTILIFSVWGLWKNKQRFLNTALIFGVLYLGFGVVQRERAESAVLRFIDLRNQQPERLSVKPSFANILLWRSTYLFDGKFYVDAVQVGPLGGSKLYPGDMVDEVDIEAEFIDLAPRSVLKGDLKRFAFFSDDYLAWHPQNPNILGDLRYSMLPDSMEPLWGIVVDRTMPEEHVHFVHFRENRKNLWKRLFSMICRR